MKALFCIFLMSMSMVTVDAVPSNALILRRFTREATSGFFSDDTGVSANDPPINTQWEKFLIPSPMVISLLGQLMVVSTKIDFPLTEYPPRDGFKYMRHPESFRASLVQVTNDGWQAFMNAHTNMDQIQLYMQQIPVQIKTSMKILSGGSTQLVGDLLPISLNQIQKIGETCVNLSSNTANGFDTVMLLLGELLEVTTSSQGGYEHHLAEVKLQLNVTAEQKIIMDNILETLKKKQKEVDDQVAKYRSDYDKALDDIPTGFKAIMQDALRAGVNVLNAIPSLFSGSSHGGGPQGGGQSGELVADFSKSQTFAFARGFFDQIRDIKGAVIGLLTGKHDSSKGTPSSMFETYLKAMTHFETLLKPDASDELSTKVSGLVTDGKQMCQDLENIYKFYPPQSNNESEAVLERLRDLENKTRPIVKEGDRLDGGLAMVPAGPTRQVMGDGSRYEGTGGSERYKADMALQRLRDTEAREDHYFDEVMKQQEEMKILVGEMAKLNLQEIDFEKILVLIKEGINKLAKIRDQWTDLIQYFSMVANRAKVALNGPMTVLLEQAKKSEHMAPEDRNLYLGILIEEAESLNKEAYFLYTLSSTYVDVSTRFLMNRLAGLAQLLATVDEAEQQKLLKSLATQANEAQDAIKQISQQKRDEYKRLVEARKRELDDILKKLDGPDSVLLLK
jgi:hypothetical protein